MAQTTATKPTAHETYTKLQNDIKELAKLVTQGIDTYDEARRDEEGKVHWGHVGDLLHERQQLVDIAARLNRIGEDTIEQELSERAEGHPRA